MTDHTPAQGNAPGLPKSKFNKARSEYDDDITFSIEILMDRFRGLAAMIEMLGEHHGDLNTSVKRITDEIYFIADSVRHLADEGDLLARYAYDELKRKAAA
ncbi:hypothetical protein [Roseinatronobacter alkalisoli]|uniref:Uncharacterized protein n=1 Tax=Roseinatronobacter alkalisoli TaxID=3028235 RepID=A0ABT5T747_9RHOB|nr:hypothetical protein [Roseinatronobacter sp. HJB301]MDD7970216.1 hypothetical protein [Roseinatronobacter sp. HJB301]